MLTSGQPPALPARTDVGMSNPPTGIAMACFPGAADPSVRPVRGHRRSEGHMKEGHMNEGHLSSEG